MLIPIGKFAAGAATRQLSRWEFQLLEPLMFNDPQLGQQVVPAGFTSDLASVRILREVCRWAGLTALFAGIALTFWSWLAPLLWLISVGALALYGLVVGYGMRAAILHDWLYSQGQLPRRQCDALFYRALTRGDGTADWRAVIFWLGVRLGGAPHYGAV
ncbi:MULTISPECIES: DUF1353 domain-containing protein [unclassified Pseudomonas]|uniref:DUF1353 domain-containing protein n=1 Tax=unclassified Pseudomonas TaxID=196821 RepID=UPI000BD70651|nr:MULTISPECIES: DUF1353 domain-containing protein [unclassified Pseudomonas]PVZ19909.1 uncharacterized protein DUF1353 [Pseudomonas sp. URIL14HWK12:I12]PVZ26975.1 uncharacterized protein DUF1353 [Pseudomonas sp. URIL14HWK12:I10]PVZ37864.1 uncharacterized protein DUF1353 [Pseudomonas sp. URIL14HWK12:I11]SNZ05362.1 Protein of unknown function [Pseudomonas sp. URIL14HWK12:I9]